MTTAHFTCDEFDALLPDLVDETIDAGARALADAHAESCARCRGLLADLVEIRVDASRLPVLKASHDLWDGINSQLKRRPETGYLTPETRWFHSPVRLAAAAVLLVASTATVTWTVAMRGVATPEAPVIAAASAVTPSARVAVAYDATLATLGALVAERRAAMDSVTAREIAASMRVIDDAILRVRAALDANPGSAMLSRQLAFAYQQKVNTLRRVAELSAE